MIHSFRKLSKLREQIDIYSLLRIKINLIKKLSTPNLIQKLTNTTNKTNRLLLLLTLSKKKKKRKKDTGFRFIEFPSDLAKN